MNQASYCGYVKQSTTCKGCMYSIQYKFTDKYLEWPKNRNRVMFMSIGTSLQQILCRSWVLRNYTDRFSLLSEVYSPNTFFGEWNYIWVKWTPGIRIHGNYYLWRTIRQIALDQTSCQSLICCSIYRRRTFVTPRFVKSRSVKHFVKVSFVVASIGGAHDIYKSSHWRDFSGHHCPERYK